MKILVIGGAGFIGSHLCEAYSGNHDVTSIDNYISGKTDNHIDQVEYINLDVENILSLDKKFDIIFHLGEYSRVEQSFKDYNFVIENNNFNMLKVLEFSQKKNCKLIYSGSSTKFGKPIKYNINQKHTLIEGKIGRFKFLKRFGEFISYLFQSAIISGLKIR